MFKNFLLLALLVISQLAYGERCELLFQNLADDQAKILKLLEKDFADDLVSLEKFQKLAAGDARDFVEAISRYDYSEFKRAMELMKSSPEQFERLGKFDSKIFLLEAMRPGSALKRFERNKTWVYAGSLYSWRVPEFKEGVLVTGQQKQLREALVQTRDFLDDSAKVHARMQDFEDEVMVECLKSDPDYFAKDLNQQYQIRQASMERVLGRLEQKHGFLSTAGVGEEYAALVLEKKSYGLNDWFEMLKQGHAFNDSGFLPSSMENLATVLENERNGHGYFTHRLQWYVLMKEMDSRPADFHHLPASEMFKSLGDMEFNQLMGAANNSGDTLWQNLFDSFSGSYHQPEFFRKTHTDYPDLGPWM